MLKIQTSIRYCEMFRKDSCAVSQVMRALPWHAYRKILDIGLSLTVLRDKAECACVGSLCYTSNLTIEHEEGSRGEVKLEHSGSVSTSAAVTSGSGMRVHRKSSQSTFCLKSRCQVPLLI